MENVKNDTICHVTRQNQYNPARGGATIMNFIQTMKLVKTGKHHGKIILIKMKMLLMVYTKKGIKTQNEHCASDNELRKPQSVL